VILPYKSQLSSRIELDLDEMVVRYWLLNTARWSLPVKYWEGMEGILPPDLVEWLPEL
jgi:hypothetical protein